MAKKKSKVPLAKKKAGIGSVVGSIANVAGNILPGPLGLAAKGLGKLFNDPTWWQDPRVSAPSSNQPLKVIEVEKGGTAGSSNARLIINRPWMIEFAANAGESVPVYPIVIPESLINQYVIRDIRMAIGAVPLQTPASYTASFNAMARLTCLYHHVKKLLWLIDNPKPHLPAYQAIYPALRAVSYPLLKALHDRLAESMRAYVKLPNITLQVIAWRFGRVYKALDDGQSAYVMYNPLPFDASADQMSVYFETILGTLQANSQAGADIHRTYADHDQDVQIHNDTQCMYDLKEKCLRDNLTVSANSVSRETTDTLKKTTIAEAQALNDKGLVKICLESLKVQTQEEIDAQAIISDTYSFVPLFFDSELDQDAIALSSTVSTSSNAQFQNSLFPVAFAQAHVITSTGNLGIIVGNVSDTSLTPVIYPADFLVTSGGQGTALIFRMNWNNIYEQTKARIIGVFSLASQLAYHNSIKSSESFNVGETAIVLHTAEACDMAFVDKRTIEQFKEYAFANMVSRKIKRAEPMSSQVDAVLKEMSHVVDESAPG